MTDSAGTGVASPAADWLRAQRPAFVPSVAIILGSGLGGLAQEIEQPLRAGYDDIPGWSAGSVAGHAAAVTTGTLAGVPVIAFAGRFHVYEANDAARSAMPVRLAHALGARVLIITNAAGGIRPTFRPGDLMLIRDHINLMFRNPLVGPRAEGDARFPDMSSQYDAALRQVAGDVAREAGIDLHDGVYIAGTGPSYETPAEIRMSAALGGDAVGMSTIPEVIVAAALGMRVLGVSCITNLASGISTERLSHEDVLETTAAASARLTTVVRGVIARIRI